MTKTASAMSVTQSAVSKILRDLSDQLGFALFTRTKGGLEPSTAALALFREVQRSFSGLERIGRAADRIAIHSKANHPADRFRIAAIPALCSDFLPRVVAAFVRECGDVDVDIHAAKSWEIEKTVASGNADIGFVNTPITPGVVGSGALRMVDCVCLLTDGHPLARKAILSLADFEDQPFISLPVETTTRLNIDAAFQRSNIHRHLAIEADWTIAIGSLVQNGLGVSITDPFSAENFAHRGGAVRPLRESITFSFIEIFSPQALQSTFTQRFLRAFDLEFKQFVELQASTAAAAASGGRQTSP